MLFCIKQSIFILWRRCLIVVVNWVERTYSIKLLDKYLVTIMYLKIVIVPEFVVPPVPVVSVLIACVRRGRRRKKSNRSSSIFLVVELTAMYRSFSRIASVVFVYAGQCQTYLNTTYQCWYIFINCSINLWWWRWGNFCFFFQTRS